MPLQVALVAPGPVENTPEGHWVQEEAPPVEYVNWGHRVQLDTEVAPRVAEAVPGGQGVGSVEPGGQ